MIFSLAMIQHNGIYRWLVDYECVIGILIDRNPESEGDLQRQGEARQGPADGGRTARRPCRHQARALEANGPYAVQPDGETEVRSNSKRPCYAIKCFQVVRHACAAVAPRVGSVRRGLVHHVLAGNASLPRVGRQSRQGRGLRAFVG